jgi:hypothetical protein
MTAPASTPDRFVTAKAVADAVLYEGYVLYPYRASARKNQLRWQFGVLVPPACHESDPSERAAMRTECIVDLSHTGAGVVAADTGAGHDAEMTVRIRCLQIQHRSVEVVGDLSSLPEPLVPWDEAIEQCVDLPLHPLAPLATSSRVVPFRFPPATETEDVRPPGGEVVARLVRRRELVTGQVTVTTEPVPDTPDGAHLVKVTVTVENTQDVDPATAGGSRDDMLRRSLVAVHTMLAVDGGTFVSLIDPSEAARPAVAGCTNDGTFPVLIGDRADGAADVLLSSPIILYDHPEVAPESPGDLYDATEIDEILALRVLTLTDEEKAEARATDARAAAIVDRVDHMPPELWERLHGATRMVGADGFTVPTFTTPPAAVEPDPTVTGDDLVRSAAEVPWWDPSVDAAVDPWSDTLFIGSHEVGKGSRVRLCPAHGADAQDLFLVGLLGTVAGVFRDVDGGDHLAVTLDDDPASDLHEWQGRYRYFRPDEVEVLDGADTSDLSDRSEREAPR